MTTPLHIVNKSPHRHNALVDCLRLCVADAAMLLIEDGVYAACDKRFWQDLNKDRAQRIHRYVLAPDIQARGIPTSDIVEGIAIIDYREFVALTVKHHPIQSWF